MVKSSPSRLFSFPKTEPAQETILREGDLATGSVLHPDSDAEAALHLEEGLQRGDGALGPPPAVPDPQPVDRGPPPAVPGRRLVGRRPRGLALPSGVDLRRSLDRRRQGSLLLVGVVIQPLQGHLRLRAEMLRLSKTGFISIRNHHNFFCSFL